MSKPNKHKTEAVTRNFPQQDAFQRMNYLLQASHEVSRVACNNKNPRLQHLAAFYSHTARTIAKRAVCRVAPATKRSLCPKCHSLYIPGVNSSIEMLPHHMKTTLNMTNKRRKTEISCTSPSTITDDMINESCNYGTIRVLTTCNQCTHTSSTMKPYVIEE